MKVNGKEISKEILAKVVACESPEELMKMAMEQGIELTKEQAEAYIADMDSVDLDAEQLQQVAGGASWYKFCSNHACRGEYITCFCLW